MHYSAPDSSPFPEEEFWRKGDNRKLRIGRVLLTGLLDRTLVVPKFGVGYGANHHQGLEKYVFDLWQAEKLTSAERRSLDRNHIRYVFLTVYDNVDGEDGSPIFSASTDGNRVKRVGTWFPYGRDGVAPIGDDEE